MAIIFIGDFRCKSLQHVYETSDKIETDNKFIIESFGTSSWFCSNALYQLEKLSQPSSSVIIMMGLLDCVNSCVWTAFDIDSIVDNYKAALEKLKDSYTGHIFYFCSVNPVDGDYPHTFAKKDKITTKVLNSKIKDFNEKMKKDCPVTFLDSYNYFETTKLNTRDGLHYTSKTAIALQNFIINQVGLTSISFENTFMSKRRLTTDDAPHPEDESFQYWLTNELNGCISIKNNCALPNCTGYAWGRFYEIAGIRPKLSTRNAEYWYSNTGDGYERGRTPKEGAVICWQKGDLGGSGAGHVAIVEKIVSENEIIVSESNYRDAVYDRNDSDHFKIRTLNNSNGNWGFGSSYTFQGFIYNPQTIVPVKTDLCTKNSYSISREEMQPNAQYIWQYLGSRGWTKNAVAALLGNLEQESKMSPCIWEGVIDGSIIDPDTGKHTLNTSVLKNFSGGYGLVQWTPYTKYINWCQTNNLNYWEIDSQLKRIEGEVEASAKAGWEDLDQWISKPAKGYNMTFKEFTTSSKSAYELAGAFAFCYERPARSTGTTAEQSALKKERGENANYWYNIISNCSTSIITTEKQFRVNNLKLDSISSTQAQISVLITSGNKLTYQLYQSQAKTNKVENTEDIEEDNSIKIFKFKDLVPKTKYTLELEILGKDETTVSKKLTFTTPQSYPSSVESIELTPILANDFKDANNNFKLKISKPKDLGYWKNNSNGYEICLIVNGRIKKTIDIDTVTDLSFNDYDIEDTFKYKCQTGDVIQIGVRTWVSAAGTTLYDANTFKTSKAVCLLNKPVLGFLNLKT